MAGRRPLVLYIEDELQWSRHKALLERHGYDVIAATSDCGELSILSDNPVDAVILDLETPGIDGGTVLRLLKQIKPHIPALLLVSPSSKIPSGRFSAADAVILTTDAPSRLVSVLDNLLNVKYPFFTRWLANWKHRVGA